MYNANVPNNYLNNVIYLSMNEKENEFQSKLFKCNSNA